MDKKGFTLIELIIVVAIIGILAMIAIPAYVGQQTRATRTEAYTNLQNLRLLEEQHFADNGVYTISALGTSGKDHPGNVKIIQDGGTTPDSANALPGFRPGTGLSYSYWIIPDKQISDPKSDPLGMADQTPCFVAFAAGNSGSRVSGDTFAIDCNNNKNF